MKQRSLPRITLLAPVFFKTQNLSLEAVGESWGRFRDISLGGAKLVTRSPMSEGDTIIFDVILPCDNVISSAPAEVVWTKRDGTYVVCGLAISDKAASDTILKGLKALLLSQKEDYISERNSHHSAIPA